MAETHQTSMLEAGEALFLSKGYAGVGLREVLQVVGVSKGGFYHFFDSKATFAVAVMKRHTERRVEEMKSALSPAKELSGGLSWFREDWQAQMAADYVPRCLVRRFAVEIGAGFPLPAVQSAMAEQLVVLAEWIENGQKNGWLYPELSPVAAAGHLLDLWHGASTRGMSERNDNAVRAALAHMEAWLKP